MKKIALAAALVLGTATAAFAEDSSSSFSFNSYPQAARSSSRAPGPRRCADRPSERHRPLADVRPREQSRTPAASKLLKSPANWRSPRAGSPRNSRLPRRLFFFYRRFFQARRMASGLRSDRQHARRR